MFLLVSVIFVSTEKTVLSGHSKRRQKLIFKTDYRLMQVKSIAECSKGRILQYFRPSLSYYLSLRSLFCLFLSDRLSQVLQYMPLPRGAMCWSVIYVCGIFWSGHANSFYMHGYRGGRGQGVRTPNLKNYKNRVS